MPHYTSDMAAAVVFVAIIFGLIVFQVALAVGAPLGAFAWGGAHSGVLPKRLRVASLVSVVMYVLLAVVVLDRAGMTAVFPMSFVPVAVWVVFGYLCLGVVMNAVSRSRRERFVMTPTAAALAVTSLLVALGN